MTLPQAPNTWPSQKCKTTKKQRFYKQSAQTRNGHVFDWSRFDTVSQRFHVTAHDFVFPGHELNLRFLCSIAVVMNSFQAHTLKIRKSENPPIEISNYIRCLLLPQQQQLGEWRESRFMKMMLFLWTYTHFHARHEKQLLYSGIRVLFTYLGAIRVLGFG